MQNNIERVTTVTRGKKRDGRGYGREVVVFTLNKY
jgi:hypothetical protein